MKNHVKNIILLSGVCVLLTSCCQDPKSYPNRENYQTFPNVPICQQTMAIATSKALRDIRATDQKDCSSYCGKDDCTGTVRYTVDFGCTPKEGVVIGHYKIENIMCHCTEKKE